MIEYDKETYINYLKSIKVDKSWCIDYGVKGAVSYLDIPCAFDIETTSTYIDDKKIAYLYIGMFGIGEKVFYFRYWDTFREILDLTRKFFCLDGNNRLVCYVHFLGFEFQFMRKYIRWKSVFSVSERKPIKCLSIYNIEFRDSYILSAMPLEKTGDNLRAPVKKLVGNLDYSKVRNPSTSLTGKELDYCENDVLILLEFIRENIEDYEGIAKIPLTNTGKVRRYVKDICLYSGSGNKKSGKRGTAKRYRELMKSLTLDLSEYLMCKLAFQGGFTHANPYKVNEIIRDVNSCDLISSYPYVMLSEKYPMSTPILIDDWKVVDDNEICSFFRVRLYNVKSKFIYDSYLSDSKCRDIVDGVINNGRVFSCSYLETCVTSVDWRIIKKCYDFDYEFVKGYYFYTQYLPRAFINAVLGLYDDKTELKGIEGKEVEYLKSKGMLNSTYGMSVTDIIRDLIEYDNEGYWKITNKKEFTQDYMIDKIEKYDNKTERFLYYPWGIFVTAYARKNLWSAIFTLGKDYIYSDTDSVKFLNWDKYKGYFEWFNRMCDVKLKKMCDFRKIDFNRCKPKNKKGVEKLLGVWEFEGKSDYFKTLGAKRYFMYSKEYGYKLTLSGLSKVNGCKYLESLGDNPIDVMNAFNDDMYIPKEYTGKNTHTYIDDSFDNIEIVDYKGNKEKISSLSGVHLEKSEFTLSLSKQYTKFLDDLIHGYLYTGKSIS